MGRDFFFSRLNGRVRLARFSRVRLLGYLRCLIADFKKKKGLFCGTAKEVMRKLSFVKVAMY